MSTCFMPVVADVVVGDELLGVGDQVFTGVRSVVSKMPLPNGDWVIVLSDGSRLRVPSMAEVSLAPPF